MGQKISQYSFTGGELSPSLYGRIDVAKYANSVKTLKNGFVRAEGGVYNRAGLEFVAEVKDSGVSRLIPFAFNTEQTYIIEVGEEYFRFIKDGGQIIDPDTEEIIELETSYAAADLFNLKYTQNADVLTICNPSYAASELSRSSHYDWALETITFNPAISAPASISGAWTGTAGTTSLKYVVTAIDTETLEESAVSSVATISNGQDDANWTTAMYATITFATVSGASEYNVYKAKNGIYGFIGKAAAGTFRDDKITPDLENTAPVSRDPIASSNNYPSCVNYFQQRRVFANSNNNPQTLWSTQTGAYYNLNISKPLVASDAVTFTIAEREVNEIRHIVSLNDMILLTSGGEWKVNGADGVFSASPPPQLNLQSNYGCNNVQPLVSGNMILFIQAGGSVARDLGYTYVSDSYDGKELTLFASHLFENKQIIDWAYAKEPYRIVWAVMSDGSLNALTYNPQQEVMGWHQHSTDGIFESVAVVREGFEDVSYFIVKRAIGGVEKRYIERMASRLIYNAEDGFFVDSGLRYSGSPVTEISGLDHLEGEEVIVLADGGVITGKTVDSGKITLSVAASKIVVGLPYEFELETLNIESDKTQGLRKIINNVVIKIDKSRPDFFIVGSDGSESQLPRSIESINDAGLLISDDIETSVAGDYSTDVRVRIKQPYPLPLSILSITPEVSIAG